MYARCSPGWVLNDHTEDQFPNLLRCPFPSHLPLYPGNHSPVHAKTTPVPPDYGFRRNQHERPLPSGPNAPSNNPEELIEKPQTRARISTFHRDELLTQSEILEKEISPLPKEANEQSKAKPGDAKHGQDL